MKIVAVANQKGGVGKTTTSVSLAACLAEKGVKTLLIDLDPQASASSALGFEEQPGCSLYTSFIGEGNILSVIKTTTYPNLCVIPSEKDLAGIEIEIAKMDDNLLRLRQLLEPLRRQNEFDFAIMDCPPSLGTLMTQALAAADSILVPLQCEYLSLEGLSKIVGYIDRVRDAANPGLHIEGILMTMFDARTRHSQSVINEVKEHMGDKIYRTIIPRTVRLSEAPSFGLPITAYDKNSTGTVAYRALADEFLSRQKKSQY